MASTQESQAETTINEPLPTPGLSTTTTATPSTDTPFPPAPIFTTPRLTIRPMHPNDAPSISQQAGTPLIAKYMSLSFPSPYTLAAAQNWININLGTNPQTHFIIAPLSSPTTAIGGIGIQPGRDTHTYSGELGYWIGEEYWGKGLMVEAITGLVQWVFGGGMGGEYPVKWRKLFAQVVGAHKASVRVLEKCGFGVEGVMKEHVVKEGKVDDFVILGLTRGQWEEWRVRKTEEKGGAYTT